MRGVSENLRPVNGSRGMASFDSDYSGGGDAHSFLFEVSDNWYGEGIMSHGILLIVCVVGKASRGGGKRWRARGRGRRRGG